MRPALAMILITLHAAAQASGQSPDRDRARPQVRAAWEHMRSEDWAGAARSFQDALEIDPAFEDAYYGLGLANVRMKNYGEAVVAYVKCRDLYRAQTGRRFTSQQEAQRSRRERVTEVDDAIRQNQQAPQTPATQTRLRQLQEYRRQLQEIVQRGNSITIENAVPAYVYLGLGSAFFRLEQWEDAEREYKSAIAADPKTGEAYNNLAVVYLTTGRVEEADKAVLAAERAGFKVSPGLKEDIQKKKG